MPDVSHILDAIDHALEDWAVSEDAMRWAPGPRTAEVDSLQLPAWIADYQPPDTTHWQTLGTIDHPMEFRIIDEAHEFEEADLRPLRGPIQATIQYLTTTYSDVFERVFMHEWTEGRDD